MGAESSRAIIECKKTDGTILDVHGQRLGEVDKKLLGKFPRLVQLNLSDNGLKYLPTDISKLQKLEKLLCSGNELADLPHSAANLPALKELDLSANRLRHFPQEIRQHSQLRVLRLASNQIVELPLVRLPKLVSLSLANNALPLLPSAALSSLAALTNLNVERNQLSFWPIEHGVALPNLQSLNCSYNGIGAIPDEFADAFQQLTELRLAATLLSALPTTLSRLTKLTSLDVSNNALRTLAPVFTLSNLEKLCVNSNRLASLDGIGVLASLSRLEAAANALRALPAEVTSLRHLEALRLEQNELSTLPAALFLVTQKLTELVVHHNALTDLPEEISRLKQLEILDVSHNKIGGLSTAIVTMPSLKSLVYDGSQKPPHLQAPPSRKLLRSTSSNTMVSSLVQKSPKLASTDSQASLDLSQSTTNHLRHIASESAQDRYPAGSERLRPTVSQPVSEERLKSPDTSPQGKPRKEKKDKSKRHSASMPAVPSLPVAPVVPASAPNVATQPLRPDASSSSSFIVPPLPMAVVSNSTSNSSVGSAVAAAAATAAVPALKVSKGSGIERPAPAEPAAKSAPTSVVERKDSAPSSGISNTLSTDSSGSRSLKSSGLNLAATVAHLDTANVGDVRRLRMYLAEGKEAWVEEFSGAEGVAKLVAVAERSVRDASGKSAPLLAEVLECLRVLPAARIEEIRSVPRVFSVLCLALEPPIADDSALAALVPRIQLAALRLLVDVTKASSTPQPLLDGLSELQERIKLPTRFHCLAHLLSAGTATSEFSTAGLALINALLATPDDVELRSRLRGEIEAAGIRPLLAMWRSRNDSSMRLQLRNYAEALEFDETSMLSPRNVHMSPRFADAQVKVLIVPLQKTFTVPLDNQLTFGALRSQAAAQGLSDADEYAMYVPSENAWLREESCLLSAFLSRPQRVELRLLPWTFRLSAATDKDLADESAELDPHLTCAQLVTQLMRRFNLSADSEYELVYVEDSGSRTPLDPTETLLRYKALKRREGKLVLKKMRKDIRIELPPSARTGSHIRRVSATISLKEQLASLASQGFMPAGDVALFRESSGDWVSTDALDDLEASDVLRITAKPREVNVAIPPTGKKVTLLVSTSEQPQTVIRRLATRYFAKDLTVAKSLVLVNATLGTPLVEGKTLREQGFDPSHDLAAVAKEETAAPKALRVPSTASDDPTLVLNAPEAGDVQAKGADLQAATLNALLRHLTDDAAVAAQEGPAFLLCFRTTATPYAVLCRLLERYRGVSAAAPGAAEKTRVRDAVSVLVVSWVESYPEDFESDQSLLRLLTDLNRLAEKEPTSPKATAQLQEACAIAMTGSKAHRRLGQRAPLNSADLAVKAAKMHSHATAPNIGARLLEADSSEVARQLTRIDYSEYKRVRPTELLHQAWNNEQREKRAPHLTSLIARFNYIAGLVTETVLLQTKLRHRVKAMSYMIKIAAALRELNNYWSLMAVISGLSHSAITRLRWTQKKLPNSVAQDFEQLKALMSPSDNWRAYRTLVPTLKPPCIPYLGMHFQDLVFTGDGNPDKIRQPNNGPTLINFTKHKQIYACVSALRQFQPVAYDIDEQDDISVLVAVPVALMTEEQLYAMSLEREPRNADISDVQ